MTGKPRKSRARVPRRGRGKGIKNRAQIAEDYQIMSAKQVAEKYQIDLQSVLNIAREFEGDIRPQGFNITHRSRK